MIPVKDTFTQVDTIEGREIAFGIGDPRWMMRSAAKLYSDITTAIIREYSTNAHDANVMADNPDPIEVTLPSMMNPYFIVEDKGVGMNMEDFEQIYTQFGNSNKRELEDTNGVMGFGSKSGVAYTTSFQVVSVKDGLKIHGVVQRKPDWAIVLKVVKTSKTDEPNGTRITIPVHNVEEFNHKAQEFYQYWLPGRVNINGKPSVQNVGEKIVDGLYYSTNWNDSRVVMGNVAYRINNPRALFHNTQMNHINFVAYVDGAEVEFTPSREDLEYSDHTKATLHKIVQDFEREIKRVANAEIDGSATHAEAYKAWSKWTTVLGRNLFADLEFKGDKFVFNFPLQGTRYNPKNGRGAQTRQIRDWDVAADAQTIYVTEYFLTLSSRHKQMIKDYAKTQGWAYNYVVFTASKAEDIVCPWISKDMLISYEDLKAATPKKPRTPSQSWHPNAGRVPGSWDYYTKGTRVSEQPIPNNGETLYWIGLQEDKSYDETHIMRLMGEPDSVVIIVPGNREPKFRRENPTVPHFITYARSKIITEGASLLSDDAKKVLGIDSQTRNFINSINVDDFADPEIAEMGKIIRNERLLLKPYDDNKSLAKALKRWYDVKEYGASLNNIFKKYPMLDRASSMWRHAHAAVYCNAVYAAEMEKKNDSE